MRSAVTLSIAALIASCVGCTRPAVAVTSQAAGAPETRDARWALTYPDLAGTLYVATSGSSTYVLGCGVEGRLQKLDERGTIVWSRPLGRCFAGLARPLAASDGGVVVAMTAEIAGKAGARVIAVDPTGRTVWDRQLLGELGELGVATTGDRVAVCFAARAAVSFESVPVVTARTGLVALELDRAGSRIRTHIVDPLYDPGAQCSYDPRNDLWLTARWDYPAEVRIDHVPRALGRGAWGLRLSGRPRFLPLYQTPSTWHTVVASGWVVHEYRRSLAFVDQEGAKPWRIQIPETGCSVNPHVIAASRAQLVASLDIFCEQRGGSTKFGDLTIEDRTEREDDLGQRTVVVELDTTTMRARSLVAPDDVPDGARYLESPRGLLVYGQFSGPLGLGSGHHSRPPEYTCLSNLPQDARTWNSYQADRPRCRAGYHLRTSYPDWPFVALLPMR
jgi:hypothetical protein